MQGDTAVVSLEEGTQIVSVILEFAITFDRRMYPLRERVIRLRYESEVRNLGAGDRLKIYL